MQQFSGGASLRGYLLRPRSISVARMNDTPLLAPLRQSAAPQAVAPDRARAGSRPQPHQRLGVRDRTQPRPKKDDRCLSACSPARALRDVLERPLPLLRRGAWLDANETLKSVDRDQYHCAFCAAGYEPTLDEIVEVTFTVNPRVRRIAAHAPDELPPAEFYRQMFWSSGVDLPDNLQARIEDVTLDLIELPAGEKAFLSLQLPPGVVIIFDPVTHATVHRSQR